MYSNEQLKEAMTLLNENKSWQIVREFVLNEIERIKKQTEKDFENDADKFYLNEKAKYLSVNFLQEVINTIDSCKIKEKNKISFY